MLLDSRRVDHFKKRLVPNSVNIGLMWDVLMKTDLEPTEITRFFCAVRLETVSFLSLILVYPEDGQSTETSDKASVYAGLSHESPFLCFVAILYFWGEVVTACAVNQCNC
jgi:hypothetical protein